MNRAKLPAPIAVVVPTYRRPALLLKTLESLGAQIDTPPFSIFVADNDPHNGDGARTALDWAKANGHSDRLQTVLVPQKGLSQNRNAGVAKAFADPAIDAIAMIDDDAEADPHWLAALLRGLSHDAAIYGGPTLYHFETDVPDWIVKADMFRVPFARSGPVGRLRSTNNCMVTRALYTRFGPVLFDPAFGISGGEDVHMFRRCQDAGLTAYWLADAKVSELVPAYRSTEDWVLRRHRNSAANIARIERRLDGGSGAFFKQSMAIGRETASGLLKLASSDPSRQFLGRLRLAGAFGRFDGLRGHIPQHQHAPKADNC